MPKKEFVAYFDQGRILVRRVTRAGRVIDFSVVLLVELGGETHDVTRYDTAHGTPHRDVIGRKKGPLAKEWFFDSSLEEVFEHAIHDLRTNAEEYIRFYQEN